jgi:UPF0755 protein
MSKGSKGIRRFFLLVMVVVASVWVYKEYFKTVQLQGGAYYLYIDKGEDFEKVVDQLVEDKVVDSKAAFELAAKGLGLPTKIKPGKYRITNAMNVKNIIAMLRSGRDEKVKLSLNQQITNLEKLIEYLDDKLALSSEELEEVLLDGERLFSVGLKPTSAFAFVIPGTIDVNWAISADSLTYLFYKRFNEMWTANRRNQAKKINLSLEECVTLASIVQSESHLRSEQEKIAGVYMNRLKKNMFLQADPTLRFANKMSGVRRFLNADKKVDSPYNTYKYKGLPPGPICLVYPQALDATLNYNQHRFYYFCARPQLNGLSDFSESYEQHQKYAETYQKSLDKRGINR